MGGGKKLDQAIRPVRGGKFLAIICFIRIQVIIRVVERIRGGYW